jgi:hypothetical protein
MNCEQEQLTAINTVARDNPIRTVNIPADGSRQTNPAQDMGRLVDDFWIIRREVSLRACWKGRKEAASLAFSVATRVGQTGVISFGTEWIR